MASDAELLAVKMAIYAAFAETGRRPSPSDVAGRTGVSVDDVRRAFAEPRAQRVLLVESDGESIRMAPPFSGVPTEHVVESGGISYFANCAWDSLGIPAALHRPAVVRSRCEATHEPYVLEFSADGPEPSDWLFHCVVPAAKWWDDIVFT